jgi:hypothetical protein
MKNNFHPTECLSCFPVAGSGPLTSIICYDDLRSVKSHTSLSVFYSPQTKVLNNELTLTKKNSNSKAVNISVKKITVFVAFSRLYTTCAIRII